MKNLTIILTLIFINSCATSLKPAHERSLKITKESEGNAYSLAMENYAMSFNNFKEVLQYSDEKKGTIILKGNVTCNELKQFGDIKNYLLQYTMKLKTSPSKSGFSFTDLYISNLAGKPVGWDYNQITSTEDLESIKPCLKGLINKGVK